MPFPYSSVVVAGTNATATAHNDARKDALTRWLKFEVIGTLVVGDKQGGSFVAPFTGTVVGHLLKTTSGTATVRTQKDGTNIDSSMSASSTYAQDTSPTSAAITKGQLITMDITAVSTAVDLVVLIEVLCTP